jgi:hypothetical protein
LPKLIQTVTKNNLTRLNISNLGCSEQQFDAIVNAIITVKQLLKLNISNIISKTTPVAIGRVVVSLVNLCLCSHVEAIVMQGNSLYLFCCFKFVSFFFLLFFW